MKNAIGLLVLASSSVLYLACAPAAGSAGKNVTMAPQGNLAGGAASAVAGTATVVVDGAKAKVTVNLSRLEPNSKHAGHVHTGTCATPGPVAVGLATITADASGNGSSTAEVDAAKLAGSVYIAFHQRAADDAAGIGGVITCGDIK